MSSRGRASYYPEQRETSRGGSRDHLMDFNTHGRNQYHDQRNAFSNEMRTRDDGGGYNHRSDTSYIDEHHAHAPRSQSWDPHSSRYPSSSQHDRYHYQERTYSSYHRKRSRSPHSNNNPNFYHDEGFNRSSRRHKSIGGGLPHDESHGLQEMQIQRAAPHPMESNGPQRNDNSYSHRYNRVNNHNHPQYHHYHSMNASHGRHGVTDQVRMQAPNFNKMNNIPELIHAAYSSLSAMSPPNTAAFWNFLLKHMGRNNQLNLSYEQMDSHINQLFEHTRRTLEMFGPKDLSQTIYSMAKLVDILRKRRSSGCIVSSLSNLLLKNGRVNDDLFRSLANASVREMNRFNAQSLSNLAYAYALIGYLPNLNNGSDLFDHIAMQSIKMRAEFDPQGISNMVWAFSTVKKRHDALFKAMGDQVVAQFHLRDFRPQALANIVWAYATVGVSHPELFEKMAKHIIHFDHLRDFKPQELSNIVWAYATAGVNHPQLYEKIGKQFGHLRDFRPQDLSNTVWAYATAQVSHPGLFEKMARHIVQLDHLNEFKPQELSNTVWAYATAEVSDPHLFEKMASHIAQLDHLNGFIPQALSNTVWAYATAQVSHPGLFEKMADHIVGLKSLDRFSHPQDVSNTVWAYSTAQVSHSGLFEKMASHIVQLDHLGVFKPQELSNTVWAYAKAQVFHPALFEKVASHIVRLDHLNEFKPQNLSNTVWAYAKGQVSHPALFDKVGNHIVGLDDLRLRHLKPQDISNTMWAYATAQVSNQELFRRFEHHIAGLDHTRDFSPQALSNIEWAYSQAVQKEDLFITPVQDTEIFCYEDDDEDLFGSSSPAISSSSFSMEASPFSSIEESNTTTLLSPSESEVETRQPCLPNDEDDAASSKHIECKDQKSDEEIITTEDDKKLNEFSQRIDSACNILLNKFCLPKIRRTRTETISTESYTNCSIQDMIELVRQRREEYEDDSSFRSSDSDTDLSQEHEDDIDEYMREMAGYKEGEPRFQPPSKDFNPFRSRNGSESDSDHDEVDCGLDVTSVAKRSAEKTVKNILNDKSRILHESMSLNVVREMISAKCEGCGRLPVPGATATNGLDRRFNHLRVYKKDLCDTLCTNCNFSKGTSDPSEWIHTSLKMVLRRSLLLGLCGSSEEEFMECVRDPKHFFGNKEKSISATRKGDPQDLECIIPGIVAAYKASNCFYCGCNQGGGIDRVVDKSYVGAGADKQLAPCCSDCNLHKGNRPLFDVLVQATINILYLAENYDPSNPVHIAYTTPTDGMMSYLSKQRKPIKCTIGGVLIMFPSKWTMEEFYAKIPDGTLMSPVSVLEYKEWRDGLSTEDNEKIRNALDIRPIQDVLRELTKKRDLLVEHDERLRKLDSANDESEVNEDEEEEEEEEEEVLFRADFIHSLSSLPTASSEKKSSAFLASVDDDELDRDSFRTSRANRRNWRLRIEDMDGRLLANVDQRKHVQIFFRGTDRVLSQKLDNLDHSDTEVIRIGYGGRRKAMFKMSRLKENANIGMTKLGRRLLHSNEVKYPNGIAITDSKDRLLAACSTQRKAAKLMNVGYNGNGKSWITRSFKGGKYKVRYLTNDDAFGVTELGKSKLPGWTKNFKD